MEQPISLHVSVFVDCGDLSLRTLFLSLAMSVSTLMCGISGVSAQESTYRLQRPNFSSGSWQSDFPDPPSSSANSQFMVRPSPKAESAALNIGKAVLSGFAASAPLRQAPLQQASIPIVPIREAFAPLQGSASGAFSVASVAELKRLSNRDVVIIVDKSRSMSEADCPSDNVPAVMSRLFFGPPSGNSGVITRWEWCQRQTMHVASQLQRQAGSRMKLVLFDDRVSEFDNVSLTSLPEIFTRFRPSGGTNATKALKTVFQEYFQRKQLGGNVRPLSVVFITDGAPSSPTSLKDLIIETSLKLNHPSEIALSFLQIGNDDDGDRLLPELDYNMVNEGARFDFVSSRNFASVSRTGLMRALLDTAR
jgi:hypothetical protein